MSRGRVAVNVLLVLLVIVLLALATAWLTPCTSSGPVWLTPSVSPS